MKVYKNTRTAGYSGGMILVAANSKEQAIHAFRADPKFNWAHEFVSCENPPFWDEYYYPADGWEEMPQLTAKVDLPQVLIENGYTE